MIQNCHRVTLLTDIELADHSSLDKYFRTYYGPTHDLLEWRQRVKDGRIRSACDTVVLAVGNGLLPLDKEISPKTQMKRLIEEIIDTMIFVKKIVVTSVLPRADAEVQYEGQIKDINMGFGNAVKMVKRASIGNKRKVQFLATHKLFLEKYEYFDFMTGHTSYQFRMVKPLSRFYDMDTYKLNTVGIYHIRSYILKILGIRKEGNDWNGIPIRREPPEVQEALREAWIKAHGDRRIVVPAAEPAEAEGDTEVEDEYPLATLMPPPPSPNPSSDTDSNTAITDGPVSSRRIPIYVGGKVWFPPSDSEYNSEDRM